MAIDRIGTLRNAEKLLRQGKLDQAIAEYGRVVAEDPHDWNTANLIGDLYVRAGRIDKAVEQFLQIADGLCDEGYLPKAGAIYKKIVKLKPDHEHALLQAADIVAGQGLYADARGYLTTVVELRRGRGDARGVAQARIRIGSLDPQDLDARLDAARARVEVRDSAGALSDFKAIAAELAAKGRTAEAIEALREAAAIDGDDPELRQRLLDVYMGAADFERALQCAATVEQFKTIARRLDEAGRGEEAIGALRQAAALDPSNTELRAQLGRTFLARGDVATASEYLTAEAAGSDPQLLMTVVEIRLRAGDVEEGCAVARRVLAERPDRRQDLATLGCAIGEQSGAAPGFRLVEMAADAAIAAADYASAAATLEAFAARVPNHIPALMRLVEVCVDGGLEGDMYVAQAALADAYIETGAAAEARFIAEDLVAREPWEQANIDRFRRALVLLGESDPDAIIAERLSGESPFMSTDLSFGADDLPGYEPPSEAAILEEAAKIEDQQTARDAPFVTIEDDPYEPPSPVRPHESRHFELSANAIDLGSILGEAEPPASAHAFAESVEVDLSVVLEDIKKPARPEIRPAQPRAVQAEAAPAPASPATERPIEVPAPQRAPSVEPLNMDESLTMGEPPILVDESLTIDEPLIVIDEPLTIDQPFMTDDSFSLDPVLSPPTQPREAAETRDGVPEADGPADRADPVQEIAPGADLAPPADLDAVFAAFREEAAQRGPAEAADEAFQRGLALHAAGRLDDCISALQTAARAPQLRFSAAALLGRVYASRNMTAEAIEWFERAAEAPAPTREEGQTLLYDLAASLERSGEVARALAIFMELQADAGSYRDVPARVTRLANAQTRG